MTGKGEAMENHNIIDSIKSVFVPIHREGYQFIAIFAVVTSLLMWAWAPLGLVGFEFVLFDCRFVFLDFVDRSFFALPFGTQFGPLI